MKKLFFAVLCIFACVSLNACDLSFDRNGGEVVTNLTKLSTPSINEVVDNYVYWDEVPNASSYIVKINGYQENAGNSLKYSIASIMDNRLEYNVETELHIYIKARGNQIMYSDSDWSNEYVFNYTKTKSQEVSELDFPKNIDFRDNRISWDAVAGASYYQVEITVMESTNIVNRSINYYDLFFNENTTFIYRVRTVKEKNGNSNFSSWSASQIGNYAKASSKVTFNQSHLEKGLGKTVNLINGAYNEVMIGGSSIFDESKLSKLYISTNSIRKGSQIAYTGDSIEKYIDDYISKVDVKFSLSKIKPGQKKLVSQKSLGLDLSIDKEYSIRSESETSYYFYTFENSWQDEEIYFDAYKNKTILTNALSNTFISDARTLQNNITNNSINNFINTYGTHLITDAIFGAKLSVNYSLIGTKSSVEEKSKNDVKVDLGVSKNYWEAEVGVDASTASLKYKSSSDIVSNLSVNFMGGENMGFIFNKNDLSGFDDAYQNWAKTTNNKDNNALIDVRDRSLYCIWDLLDDNEFKTLKESLDKYLDKSASDSYYEYSSKLDKFINNGKIESGYKRITSAKEFVESINNNLNGSYIIMNDLDFNNEAITSFGTFSGTIKGYVNNGVKPVIKNFQLSSTNQQYLGLFRELDKNGKIIDIDIDNCNVVFKLDDKGKNVGSLGALAGYSRGEINNCNVTNSKFDGYLYRKIGTYDELKLHGGAITGWNGDGKLVNCRSVNNTFKAYCYGGNTDGTIEVNVGGIAGMNNGDALINNCKSSKIVIDETLKGGKSWTFTNVKMKGRAGGIAGYNGIDASVMNCRAMESDLANYNITMEKAESCKYDDLSSKDVFVGKNAGSESGNIKQ